MQTKLKIIALIILCSCSSVLYAQSEFVYNLYFKPGAYEIDKKYLPMLNEIGKACASDSFNFLKLFAFADTVGSAEFNDALSEKRATGVYNYLAGNFNTDSTKILVTWLGEDADVYDLHFPGAHAQKRCVDIIVSFRKRKE
jgi:outer membrane protein OmpA-like peptidoglycan-associated protein